MVGIDCLNDAYDPRLKNWRLQQLSPAPDFLFRQLDICDRPALAEVFATDANNAAPYGAVVNLAARAGVRPSVEDPWIYFEANTTGALNLLELCRQHGVPKFVQASTSSLYGANHSIPFREDDNTDRPLSPYAASKKAAEALAYTYHHLHGIDVTALRFFTVYGPAGRPDMSVFRFIRRIAEGLPIVVYGDGLQQRDFTHVDDIARGVVSALRPLGYEIINLGSDRPHELRQMIAILEELLGRAALVEYQPAHAADAPATWASVERAQQLLQWQPQIDFRGGLASAVRWYQDNRNLAISLRLD